ncbi:reverse transcriptase [Caerostris extrusa]|uniref:Reverse transcriptase n=1 Tax=Caerostris extrusa TaxID=172846 RepID=A0AAV4WQ38_CAEEX|nr:reverse transcriptase [Caerostris extrusa]
MFNLQKYYAKPSDQLTGQLPKDRISQSPPFCIVGLGFASTIIIGVDKNRTEKSYVVLFTCAVTRAVNLELVMSMTTKSFLLALRRFLSRRVTWKFIIERAPWWGGFYERLVKDPLRKILGRAILTFEELSTILTEIEAVINMRPLTYTTNDLGETEPLTPAHFLHFGKTEFSNPLHFADLVNKTLTRRLFSEENDIKQIC